MCFEQSCRSISTGKISYTDSKLLSLHIENCIFETIQLSLLLPATHFHCGAGGLGTALAAARAAAARAAALAASRMCGGKRADGGGFTTKVCLRPLGGPLAAPLGGAAAIALAWMFMMFLAAPSTGAAALASAWMFMMFMAAPSTGAAALASPLVFTMFMAAPSTGAAALALALVFPMFMAAPLTGAVALTNK